MLLQGTAWPSLANGRRGFLVLRPLTPPPRAPSSWRCRAPRAHAVLAQRANAAAPTSPLLPADHATAPNLLAFRQGQQRKRSFSARMDSKGRR
jgi:hypothetical protein